MPQGKALGIFNAQRRAGRVDRAKDAGAGRNPQILHEERRIAVSGHDHEGAGVRGYRERADTARDRAGREAQDRGAHGVDAGHPRQNAGKPLRSDAFAGADGIGARRGRPGKARILSYKSHGGKTILKQIATG